ncbi:MAG TPA: GtrA family protein [Methylovirgula sp.]|nr:GtrA family protein [Methylovirgula sp.]
MRLKFSDGAAALAMAVRSSAWRTERGTNPAAGARAAAIRLFASDLVLYGLCSAAALAVDWSLLILFVKAGVNYLAAAALSFLAGMVLAYFGSAFLIFRARRGRNFSTEIFGFFAIGFAGLALNQVLIFLFVHFGGLEVALAKAPTAALVFLFNFLLRRALLFAPRP